MRFQLELPLSVDIIYWHTERQLAQISNGAILLGSEFTPELQVDSRYVDHSPLQIVQEEFICDHYIKVLAERVSWFGGVQLNSSTRFASYLVPYICARDTVNSFCNIRSPDEWSMSGACAALLACIMACTCISKNSCCVWVQSSSVSRGKSIKDTWKETQTLLAEPLSLWSNGAFKQALVCLFAPTEQLVRAGQGNACQDSSEGHKPVQRLLDSPRNKRPETT